MSTRACRTVTFYFSHIILRQKQLDKVFFQASLSRVLGDRLMAGRAALTRLVKVRILLPQPSFDRLRTNPEQAQISKNRYEYKGLYKALLF